KSMIEYLLGDFNAARAHIEPSLKIVELLRVKTISREMRTSYFGKKHVLHEFYINLLMQIHKQEPTKSHDFLALQASERARARSLIESLTEARADIRQGVDPALLTRELKLQQQLNAKAETQLKLLSGSPTEAQASAIKKELDALTTDLQQIQTQIRQASPRYAALTQPQPLTAAEIQQQVLDADTLLLEYALGNERSFLWAVTPTAVSSYELPKREVIEAAAQRVYDLLSAPNRSVRGETEKQRSLRQLQASEQYPEAAAALSQMLLAPVAEQLGKKRLAIVADGMLHYLPFGALPIPKPLPKDEGSGMKDEKKEKSVTPSASFTPLIVEHEVINLPSASTLAVLRRELKDRKPVPKTLAVLADPVFAKDDPRIKSRARQPEAPVPQTIASLKNERITRKLAQVAEGDSSELRIARLPFTRQEAEQLLALVPAGERMQALDFAANRATATSEQLSQYRYVHFATHGLTDSERAELSTVLLSLFDEQGAPQDGFLRAHEVYNLNLPAEMVVLSACETGLGKQVKGEGLVSLTRGFMYAGAARVVVSLWSVNDKATAELMTKFYRRVLVEGERPAAALRAAQIEMWKTKQWEAPYYWAAFTLQGEWR
ncbi:MAG: CHAT domain-containing protein, partial [Acidobacteria bacterium]|nr:CHAT domain-containing protein [Acidobacteriota bacterium]